jgi:hypothetical protein
MHKNSNGNLIFNFEDVVDIIIMMSHSQGFWGRLLECIFEMEKEDADAYDNFVSIIEEQQFTNMYDVVRYFEGW